jgi:hypothetical protein
MTPSVPRPIGMAAAIALLTACSDAAADRPVVERTDSAGVEIVTTVGADRPIAWSFEPVLSLGGADGGPESFYQLYDFAVATDAVGNLYVLDMGNHRVVVFDPRGRHLRSMGKQGNGPGEFEWASGFSVTSEGQASLFNFQARSFMRWGPDGELLESEPVDVRYFGGNVARLPDGRTVLLVDSLDESTRTNRTRLLAVDRSGQTDLASFVVDRMEPRDFGCVRMSGMPPLLASALVWTVSDGRVFTSAGTEYRIDVSDGDRILTSIRRPVAPREVTPEMAAREVGESMKVSFGGGGGCEVPTDRVVEVRGHASHLQPVREVAVAPSGEVWVERGRVQDEDRTIDVFAPDGSYLGTLPSGSPWPAAFTPEGNVIAIEKDDLDVEHVVVYRVNRGA